MLNLMRVLFVGRIILYINPVSYTHLFTNKCLVKVAAAVVAVAPSLALKNLLVAVVTAAVMVDVYKRQMLSSIICRMLEMKG